MATVLASTAVAAPASDYRPIGTLKSDDGREFTDRKARAFLLLSPKLGEDNANLVLALLLTSGLQIVGERP